VAQPKPRFTTGAHAGQVCWIQTITELRSDLISSGKVDKALADTFFAHCADSTWWTQIASTAVSGRPPAAEAGTSRAGCDFASIE